MDAARIEEKFKECPPAETVEHVKECLKKVGITLSERLRDSGIGNCYSVRVVDDASCVLFSNGKGITVDLTRASGYAEFIERIQCGLMLYKFQSITRDPDMNLQMYAPDGKYMTKQELVENGEWMDQIIKVYGGGLTREKLAEQCQMYACTDEDKILTLPYYSLFEEKYVYLPAGFVEHMYSTNGCCAGNTRDEAWVHAISEIFERNATIRMFTTQASAPIIPMDIVNQYPTPKKIIASLLTNENLDITLYDFSGDTGYPVVGTLLIDKTTQDYVLNISADPILEIALSRGLTEVVQGRNPNALISHHRGNLLTWDFNGTLSHNIVNQYETGEGLLSSHFFTDPPSREYDPASFEENSNKTNAELLQYSLGRLKRRGLQVYVRNCSFLGFHTYMMVVPGFSEVRGLRLTEKIQEYGLGDATFRAFRNPSEAPVTDFHLLLMYVTKMQGVYSRRTNFARFAGLPMQGRKTDVLLYCTLSYAAYRLGQFGEAAQYLMRLLSTKYKEDDPLSAKQREYLQCLSRYLNITAKKASAADTKTILTKFYTGEAVTALYQKLESKENLYEGFLLKCDTRSCASCPYSDICDYTATKERIQTVGAHYSRFTDGQSKEIFKI